MYLLTLKLQKKQKDFAELIVSQFIVTIKSVLFLIAVY